jgi:topoisomerase IV subunit A
MNVLTADRTPRVLGLRDVLRAWLDHRHEVLVRRSRHRLAAIDRRLEILDGYLAVFLNLDEVIRIIRFEDEPKPELIRAFTLTEAQAEAILNMRLRSLRRLEEAEIRREHKALSRERKDLAALLGKESLRWDRIAAELAETRDRFGSGPLGDRRTVLGAPPPVLDFLPEAAVEREPITVILSEKGWVRAVRGHLADGAELKFKEGDKLRALVPCQTTDRLCLLGTNGRAYTLRAGDLPRGRGDGQPIKLLIELGDAAVATVFPWQDGARYLVAGSGGRGFVVKAEDMLAEKRTGKGVLTLKPGEEAVICVPADGDAVAVVGDNRKLLVFALVELPELARGAGVALQRYSDGGLRDAKVFRFKDGLSWKLGDRVRVETELRPWRGERGQAGKLPPNGFPRSGRFGD